MEGRSGPSPLTRSELIDEYFIENRTKVLDLAAFLDRLDRAEHPPREGEFRMEAFSEALGELTGSAPGRLDRIQMILSDPTTKPVERLTGKSARGAYDRGKEAR